MPYKNKPRPYKKEYKQQKARGEHEDRMDRQRARRRLDKKGVNRKEAVQIKTVTLYKVQRKIEPQVGV